MANIFQNRVVVLGAGSVSQTLVPLMLQEKTVDANQITIIDKLDVRHRFQSSIAAGVTAPPTGVSAARRGRLHGPGHRHHAHLRQRGRGAAHHGPQRPHAPDRGDRQAPAAGGQLAGQGEVHALLHNGHGLHHGIAVRPQRIHRLLHQKVGGGGAGGDAHQMGGSIQTFLA